MASVSIKVPGADFSAKSLGRSLKLTTNRNGLVGEYILGRNAGTCRYNGANPTLPAIVIGAPEYAAAYATLGADRWLDTRLVDNQELTILVVSNVGNSPRMLVGTFGGSNTTDNASHYGSGSNTLVAQASGTDGTAQNTEIAAGGAAASRFQASAMRSTGAAGYTTKVDIYRDGSRYDGASTVHTGKTREVNPTPSFAIGSSRGAATFPGPINIAGVLIWHRALSDAALLAVYQEVRATMATRGIEC